MSRDGWTRGQGCIHHRRGARARAGPRGPAGPRRSRHPGHRHLRRRTRDGLSQRHTGRSRRDAQSSWRPRAARSSPSTADVRDLAGLQKAFDEGMASLGRVDIVIANAGIVRLTDGGDPDAVWRTIVDTNLTGTWNTISVALPTLRARVPGGTIVITSSTAGLQADRRLRDRRLGLHLDQDGPGRPDEAAGGVARPRVDSCQQRAPDRGQVRHDHERGHGTAGRPGHGGRKHLDLGHAERHADRHPRTARTSRTRSPSSCRTRPSGSREWRCRSTPGSACDEFPSCSRSPNTAPAGVSRQIGTAHDGRPTGRVNPVPAK